MWHKNSAYMRSSIIASWCNTMLADGTVGRTIETLSKVDPLEFWSLLLFVDKVESLVKLWFHRTVTFRHACYDQERKHIKTVMQRNKLQLSKNQFPQSSITNILSSSKKKSSSKSMPRPVISAVCNISTCYLYPSFVPLATFIWFKIV